MKRSLAINRGLEASVASHHLDFGACAGQIFRMRFELGVRIGEMQQGHALACRRIALRNIRKGDASSGSACADR